MSHEVRVEEEGEDKLNVSDWLVTINSNVMPKNREEVERWKKQLRRIFSEVRVINEWLIPNAGFAPDNDMRIKVRISTEIGGKFHRLHSHVIIRCEHNSNVKIDGEVLKELTGAAYVNVRYVKGGGDFNRILRYLRKQE